MKESPKTLQIQDPLITYLTLKSNHHNSKLDREYVESVYEDYAVKTDSKDAAKSEIVTKQNAWLAYEEVFKMWKIDLTED